MNSYYILLQIKFHGKINMSAPDAKKKTTANLVVIGILQYIVANGDDRKPIVMINSFLLTKRIKVNKQNKCH